MMNVTTKRRQVCVAVAGLLLAGCGGGGGDPAASEEIAALQGAYGGTVLGGSANALNLLVLEDGAYWGLYGTAAAGQWYVSGFIQGTATASSGTFRSGDTRDFGTYPPAAGTISATYDKVARTITGTVTSTATGNRATFSGGPVAGSLYDYSKPASLATIAGSWSLTDLQGSSIALNVQGSGAFTASSGGCVFNGTFVPRATGKNVFDIGLTFGATGCALPGRSASGIGVAYPLASGGTQLLVAVITPDRTAGAAAFGIR